MSKAARRSIADLVQAGETKGQGATVTPIAPTAQPEKKPATRKQTTLYLEPAVMRQLKELALEEGKRPHALVIEGLDLLFQSRGLKSTDDLKTR